MIFSPIHSMEVARALLSTSLLLAIWVAASHAQSAALPTILIKDVTVIDGTGRAAQPHMTVLIANGRIADVASGKQFKLPAGTDVIDGAGKFLIPGLWNMHAHAFTYEQAVRALPAVLAAGVTGIRDMGTPLDDALRLRAEVNRGTLTGPRLMTSGPVLVRGIPPAMKGTLLLRPTSASDAIEVVSSLKTAGADFIKVEGSLSREAYFAVARAARSQNMPFAGHIPPGVSVGEASEAGQRSVEHLGGPQYQMLIAGSTREKELRAQLSAIYDRQLDAAYRGEDPQPEHQRVAITRPILDTFSDAKLEAIIARLRRNKTWQTPTLKVFREVVWNEPRLTAEDQSVGERIQEKQLAIVAAMARSGVPLLAGTDGPLSQAGPALHDELALLVNAGLSPMQALQTATRNPAEFMGRLRDLGTIERGKIADLVLLDGNPLADIANTRRVSAVLRAGQFVSPIQPQAGSGPSTPLRNRR